MPLAKLSCAYDRQPHYFPAIQPTSVGHRIGNDVDTHRVREWNGEGREIVCIFSLTFPTISKVVVVAQKRDDVSIVVEIGLKMREHVARAAVIVLKIGP